MGCGCNKGKASVKALPTTNAPKLGASKITCSKCGYWMSLTVSPATKEKSYICQNTLCKAVLPYVTPSPSQSPL